MAVIRKNEGLSNKDTAKFTDQINALCDKWDRQFIMKLCDITNII